MTGVGSVGAGMDRIVENELLDELPVSDTRAIRSRSDLRRINRLMGHARILTGLWSDAGLPSRITRLVELGAGDGTFCLELARRVSRQHGIGIVTLLDRNPCVSAETCARFRELGCEVEVVQADVFDWLKEATGASAVVANLFLHHFSVDEIASMFRMLARLTPCFLALEPRRALRNLTCSRLLGLIGSNAVTRHDAIASVRAGFLGTELSSLWPSEHGWELNEKPVGFFSHSLSARRSAARASSAGTL